MSGDNMQKEREFIDSNGNTVKPFTKEVIKFANSDDYKPTKEELESFANLPKEPAKIPDEIKKQPETEPTLTISQQIEQAKKHLADLELKKKAEIKRMKEELKRLESE